MSPIILITLLIGYVQASKPYFDGIYEAYQKDDSDYLFGYSINLVCKIRNLTGTYYAGVEDAYSFQKSSLSKMDVMHDAYKIMACFNYKGYSYIIFKLHDSRDVIVRGRVAITFKFPYNIKSFLFDHLKASLYAFSNENDLHLVNMTMLESFWDVPNYPQHLAEEHKNTSLQNIFTMVDNLRWFSVKDIIVFNQTLYYIEEGDWNGQIIMRLMKMIVGGDEIVYVDDYEKENFTVIPFVQLNKYHSHNSHVKISLNSLSPTIMVSLPSSSIKSQIENIPMFWVIILYLLDAIFVIIILYVFKYLYGISLKRINSFRNGKQKELKDQTSPYQSVILSS